MAAQGPDGTATRLPRGTVPLVRLAGVPVGAHWSVLGIVALLAVAMARVELPLLSPGHGGRAYAVAGLGAAVLVVASLLAHEAAHAVVARRLGLRVEGVTLWILGGATLLRGEPDRPGVELRMAVAGPLTSGLLGGVFLGAADLLPPSLVTAVLLELAWVNLVLAVFNLLPAAPLDGGRVLHALLWARRGDRWSAAGASAAAGRVLAWTLVLGGIALTVAAGFAGLWFVVVGWWIAASAEQEGRRARLGRTLDGLTVGQVARPAPQVVCPPRAIDAAAVHDPAARAGGLLLRETDGRLAGFVTPEHLPGAGPLVPPDRLSPVHSGDLLVDVLGGLARPDARLVVLDAHDRPVGTVAAPDVLRLAAGTPMATPGPEPGAPPPAGWWWPGGGPVPGPTPSVTASVPPERSDR
ncbi:MAG TPA: site-2 protease family protein [Actinomycetospora sp.]|jgi:Zn-dependent protease|uniref:site-2 protease family protein n=1 Tax=Actinomycetospora sp. TaxID=1872135 RepID=UPI002F40E609